MLKNCFLPVNYIKQIKPTSQTCGEIICENMHEFIISCNVCKIKTFEFEDFVKHFKKVHLDEAAAPINENREETTLNVLEEEEIYDNLECFVKVEIGDEQIALDNDIKEDPIEGEIDLQSDVENDGCSDDDKEFVENSEDDEEMEEEDEQSKRILEKPRKQRKTVDKMNTPKEYACEICNKTFQLRRGLQSHVKVVHVREKPHKCSMCDQSFALERSLKIHMCEKHTGYDCPQCNHHCANRRILLRHLAMHSGKKDFVCNEKNCGKAFPAQTYLSDHQRQSHSKNLYMCEECGFKCKVRETFYIHQRKHKGEKPFGCQQCDRSFISKSLLAEHKACHETDRKHVCDVCGKGFNRYKALFNHKQLHSDVKRYVCKICGSAYAQAPGLSAHMRKHRQQQQEVTYAPDIALF